MRTHPITLPGPVDPTLRRYAAAMLAAALRRAADARPFGVEELVADAAASLAPHCTGATQR